MRYKGSTALFRACSRGHMEVVKLLLEAKVRTNSFQSYCYNSVRPWIVGGIWS